MLQTSLVPLTIAADIIGESKATVLRKVRDGIYPGSKLPGARGAFFMERTEAERIAVERRDDLLRRADEIGAAS